jgi:hypothetical protein
MTTLNGLPAHILLVHVIVVLLPLAALLLVLCAVWPAARAKLAGPNAILSVVVLAMVPVTTNAGEWLERRVPSTPLVRAHTDLGDTALFVAVPVMILALIIWWRGRELAAIPNPPRRAFLAPASKAVGVTIMVVSVLAAGAAGYDVYRIGDSGAQAAWQGQFSSTPVTGGQRG